MMEYSLKEMMVIAAAREISDDDIVFCGTGISLLAAMAAKHINAPNSVIFFETGAIDSRLEEVPLAVADPRVIYLTSMNGSLADSFAFMQNPFTGPRVVGILGAAQIDRYGNLNSTVIGDYHHPEVRFSGSGGACDVASFVSKSIIFIQLERRKFVKKIDYITSPGWLDGAGSRESAGLSGRGPTAVITDRAILEFDKDSKEMYLKGCYPGVKPREVLDHMEFPVDITRSREVIPPSEYELNILRNKCDPQQLILK